MIPELFTKGIRELLVIDRTTINATIWHKLIMHPYDYKFLIKEAIDIANRSSAQDVRVYLSVNERSVNKAIKEFKKQQIEADFSPHMDSFYLNLSYKFRHLLMTPKCRKTKYFLIDIDTKCPHTMCSLGHFLNVNKIHQIYSYDTPNGFHMITEPFNMNMLKLPDVEIKTDALMLIHYKGKK